MTKEEYDSKVLDYRHKISKLKRLQAYIYNVLIAAIYENDEYKKIRQQVSALEYEMGEFIKEHYSDFDVYTNGERQLDTRIDGKRMRA